jgi:hypothetical protein
MSTVPRLHLTHGQVAWALCGGRAPDQRTLDSLRYLRQVGIPFTEEEQTVGRGNRLTYGFDHLIECAVALYAMRRGTRPRQAAAFLVAERKFLRKFYRQTYREIPEPAFEESWIFSGGKTTPSYGDEQFIRVHERYADTSGRIETMTLDETVTLKAGVADFVERYSDIVYPLVPLKPVLIEAVALARIAPELKRGRPARLPAPTETNPSQTG